MLYPSRRPKRPSWWRSVRAIAMLSLCATAVPAAEPSRPMRSETASVQPHAASFTARWDHRWIFAQTAVGCELSLEVGAFGRARFLASPGAALTFELPERQPLLAPGGVSRRSVAPSWHPRHPDASRWQPVSQVPGFGIAFAGEPATALLMSLYQGYEEELGATGSFGAEPSLLLTLSVLNFRSAYGAFLRCQQAHRPVSVAALHRLRVQFDTGRHQLTPEHRSQIAEIARYVAAQPRVAQVFVDGHTDDIGSDSDNHKLSRRRAQAVAEALTAEGVERSLLKVRFHGERYPVERSENGNARARNRRATVRVELGPESTSVGTAGR